MLVPPGRTSGECCSMEIHTPVHISCMCYVSSWKEQGGYNMMFVMVYLYTALEMMQNGLRTSGIG